MIIPLQVTFRGLARSSAVEEYVRRRAAKLETFFSLITRCDVAVEVPHRHHRQGRPYRVRLDITVPGEELVVERSHDDLVREDVYASIDGAFEGAQRRLEDYSRVRRKEVKHHEPRGAGRVVKLFPREGYGFLETEAGDEVYFHANSVAHAAFGALEVGWAVRFVEEPGDKGPQASRVEPLRRR